MIEQMVVVPGSLGLDEGIRTVLRFAGKKSPLQGIKRCGPCQERLADRAIRKRSVPLRLEQFAALFRLSISGGCCVPTDGT